MTTDTPALPDESALFERVSAIVETARAQAVRSVNTAMIHAYWRIGREIVEIEQEGAARATYGDGLVRGLAGRLGERYGKGFSYPSVKRMKQFYLAYPAGSALRDAGAKGSTVLSQSDAPPALPAKGATPSSQSDAPLFPPLLSWSHYLALLKVSNPDARAFYEIETARENWSVRELQRQVGALLYERAAASRNAGAVRDLARQGMTVARPADVMKDPFVLEFLDLSERPVWRESDLEQAIMDRLEGFLLELGKGFCFVGRQKRVTVEGDHFYVDLVFYNRLLRCFVLIDLKLGKLTHQDLGQMQMYVNYFDRHMREEFEAPTIGIVLCSEKNDAMVKITLPADNTQLHAGRYSLYLPSEAELAEELERERAAVEGALGEE